MICVEIPQATLRSQFSSLLDLQGINADPAVEAFISGALTAITWVSEGAPLPSAVAAAIMQVGQKSH